MDNIRVTGLRIVKKYKYVFGLMSFFLYALSFLINRETEAYHPVFTLLRAGLVFIAPVLYLLACDNECTEKVRLSYGILSGVIFVHELMLLAAVGKTIYYIRDYPALISLFMWTICSLAALVRFRKSLIGFFISVFRNRGTFILVCASLILAVLVTILSLEPNGIRFSWDSDTLYGFIYGLGFDALYDARQLMFMKVHVSLIYVYFVVLLKLLTGNIRIAFFIINTVCIFAASFGTTFLFKTLVPGKKNMAYILADALFMFSPWVCGMSVYHIYDYFIYCFFPLMVYYYYKKNWVGFFCVGTMISFSRAPGLIVFGSVCLGILLIEAISLSKKYDDNKIRLVMASLLHSIKYWYFLAVAIIFVIYFYLGRDVNRQFGDTTLGIDKDHILHLLKIYTCCNFLWLLFVPAVLLVLYACFSKNKKISSELKSFIFVIVFSDILLVLFYCLLITYRIPRYMDSHIAAVYICGTLILLLINDTRVSYAVMSLICAVTFMGSFRMIDPVSLHIFNTINVGDHKIVDFEKTDMPSFEDSIICNREYYSYEVILGNTVKYVLDNMGENDEILFSLGTNPLTWSFSGGRYSYAYENDKHYFQLFYDKTINGLANGYSYDYFDSEDMIPFDMHFIFPEENVDSAIKTSKANTFFYIYFPTLNYGKETEINEKYTVAEQQEFSFRGWNMNCIKFMR